MSIVNRATTFETFVPEPRSIGAGSGEPVSVEGRMLYPALPPPVLPPVVVVAASVYATKVDPAHV